MISDIPMPPRIAKRQRDSRGYPIPLYIVQRDRNGKPLVTVKGNILDPVTVIRDLHVCERRSSAYGTKCHFSSASG